MSRRSHAIRLPKTGRRLWPLLLMIVLMVAIGAYTTTQAPSFLTQYNVNSLLLLTLPLALVSMGQALVLLVRGFDVSVGALLGLCVVVASFTMTSGLAWYIIVPGVLAVVGTALVVGCVNAALIRRVRMPSIIATLATLSILQGIGLALRPTPAGIIDAGVSGSLLSGIGPVPWACLGVIVLAVTGDLWLYRSPSGLTARGIGLDEMSAQRLGMPSERVHWRMFIACSAMAGVASLFVVAQVRVGDSTVGSGYTLQSIAAAVLGGASLGGGKGSFVGAVIGALFLSLVVNVLPFLGWGSDISEISIGVLTLLALILYQGTGLWTTLRDAWWSLRSPRSAASDPVR
jgi:ribose transport system ATP-binding protein